MKREYKEEPFADLIYTGRKKWFKDIDEWYRQQDVEEKQRQTFILRWINRFRHLNTDDRIKIIDKINEKYQSKEYINRWYSKGIEPPTPLLDLLYEYAKQYGGKRKNSKGDYVYEIDGHFIYNIFGQGGFYTHIEKISDYNNKVCLYFPCMSEEHQINIYGPDNVLLHSTRIKSEFDYICQQIKRLNMDGAYIKYNGNKYMFNKQGFIDGINLFK